MAYKKNPPLFVKFIFVIARLLRLEVTYMSDPWHRYAITIRKMRE